MEFRLDKEQSSKVINSMENHAIEIEKAYDNEQLTDGAIFGIGIIVTSVSYLSAFSGGTYVIECGAIIIGSVRFFRGLNNKNNFSNILKKYTKKNKGRPLIENPSRKLGSRQQRFGVMASHCFL